MRFLGRGGWGALTLVLVLVLVNARWGLVAWWVGARMGCIHMSYTDGVFVVFFAFSRFA